MPLICPKCLAERQIEVRMKTLQSFKVGQGQKYYGRIRCPVCLFPATTQTTIINTDPGYGNGAYSLAKSENERLMEARERERMVEDEED